MIQTLVSNEGTTAIACCATYSFFNIFLLNYLYPNSTHIACARKSNKKHVFEVSKLFPSGFKEFN